MPLGNWVAMPTFETGQNASKGDDCGETYNGDGIRGMKGWGGKGYAHSSWEGGGRCSERWYLRNAWVYGIVRRPWARTERRSGDVYKQGGSRHVDTLSLSSGVEDSLHFTSAGRVIASAGDDDRTATLVLFPNRSPVIQRIIPSNPTLPVTRRHRRDRPLTPTVRFSLGNPPPDQLYPTRVFLIVGAVKVPPHHVPRPFGDRSSLAECSTSSSAILFFSRNTPR